MSASLPSANSRSSQFLPVRRRPYGYAMAEHVPLAEVKNRLSELRLAKRPATRRRRAPYEIEWARPARKAIARIPQKVATAVIEFIYGSLTDNPRRAGRSTSIRA